VSRRVHLLASGRVQGVAFRYFTQAHAARLGLSGWVRNLPNGDVEAVGEGTEESVVKWVRLLRDGPPAARVDNLRVNDEPPRGEDSGFDIRF
jgi:acylphosphatase